MGRLTDVMIAKTMPTSGEKTEVYNTIGYEGQNDEKTDGTIKQRRNLRFWTRFGAETPLGGKIFWRIAVVRKGLGLSGSIGGDLLMHLYPKAAA